MNKAILLLIVAASFAWGNAAHAAPPREPGSPFVFRFMDTDALEESGSMEKSGHPYWWLNSGGILESNDGIGSTLQGDAATSSKWRLRYAKSNPKDTDNGYHPQNIFRLITRSSWMDVRQEAYFRIVRDQVSRSQNRNSSNGLLLMGRYQKADMLYYAGVRVDGVAVIKKKWNGSYTTLASKKIFTGSYHRDRNPNLLPKNEWLGIRSEIRNNANGSVSITLYLDRKRTGAWTRVLEAKDAPSRKAGVIRSAGYAGMRTDFMDVEFADYRAESI